jgi:chromosome segregation ATPase
MATTFFNLSAIDRIEAKVNSLAAAVAALQAGQTRLLHQGVMVMAALDDLEAKVAEVKGVEDSVVMLLDKIHQELADAIASGDMARVQAVTASLESQRQALADAVARNPDPQAPPAGP